MADLRVHIAGVELKNPVILASGTCGFGLSYDGFYPVEALGGVSMKGTTLEPRDGNPGVRIAETKSGILNSVGLQNPGLSAFVETELPAIADRNVVKIANIAGFSIEEFVALTEGLNDTAVDMLEVNISCPNVKHGGAAFGMSCTAAAEVTRAVKRVAKKPVIVKLSPNVTDITEIAKAVEAEGADAVSLINTLLGMRIDVKRKQPILGNNVGGFSGPAVFPVALRMVWQTARAVRIPVIGLGGIATWQDAAEMILAGASAIQVGTAMFTDPFAPVKIVEGLNAWAEEEGVPLSALTGAVRPFEN